MITTILLFFQEMSLICLVTYLTGVDHLYLCKMVKLHSVHRLVMKFQCDYIARRALREYRALNKCTLILPLKTGDILCGHHEVIKILWMELCRICSLDVKVELANKQESLAKKKDRKLLLDGM